MKILGMHGCVRTRDQPGPAFLAAVTRLLIHGPSDGTAWLPRRAAQALTDVNRRLEEMSDRGAEAASALRAAVGAEAIDIRVYGRLYLPDSLSRRIWRDALRETLFHAADASESGHLALKAGPHLTFALTELMRPDDTLIYAVRHPVELFIGLTQSRVDGMRPDEAAHFVALSLEQGRHLLDDLQTPYLVVHFEDLLCSTRQTLAALAAATHLPATTRWHENVRRILPGDVHTSPRWNHPMTSAQRELLAAAATAWDYR